MMEDIYDATLIHEPEHNDVKIDGETACPDCGERVFPDLSDDVFDAALECRIAAPFDCPECSASLEFIIEPTLTEELGLGLWVVPE